MTTAVTPTIEELVGCKPEVGAVPFFDGTCREYSTINQTAQEVLECMIGEDLGITGHSITISPTNDLSVISTIDQLLASSLVGTVLTIGQNFVFDLGTLLNTSYYITDGENNYEIKNHENLRWRGIDGMHFNVGGGDIEIGLPTPVAQYFTPGRCTPGPLLAYYSGHFAGITTAITIVADNAGSAGNITLTFGAGDTIDDVIAAWNLANPANTVTLSSGDGTQEPGDGEYIALHGGADANTCQETDYMPNNKWLVLTRDCNTNSSQWMPPQCCLQTLSFDGGMITINVELPGEPLPSINTDNQQLSLTFDPSVSEMLCLSRRHGGTLGIQIPDPDSCVDLIDINSHTFNLQGNLLLLLGSDLLVNSIADLSNVNEHTLELTSDPIDPLHYHDPAFPRHDILDILGSDGTINDSVDLNGVAQEMLTLMDKLLCVQKMVQTTLECKSCRDDCVDLSILDYDCEDVSNCIEYGGRVDRSSYPDICGVITDPVYAAAREAFFCNGPVTLHQTRVFIKIFIINIQNTLIQISLIIQRQKYQAKIYVSDNNRTGWSKHTYPAGVGDPGNDNAARWLIPTFDDGQGWHSITTEMVNWNNRYIGAHASRLQIYNGASLECDRSLGTGYNTAESANNPYTQANSEFAQEAIGQTGKSALCIYIPKDGRYNVEMNGVCQADHNVHAFRMSTLRYRPNVSADEELQLLMDSKFGGGNSGSASMNNILVPATAQRQMNASKLLELKRGDVLFIGMKIDPRTIWPKYQGETVNLPTPPGGTAIARDVLYRLNDQAPAYGQYNHTAASGSCVTPDTSSVTRNYSVLTGGYNIADDEFSWMPASLPNVSPHRFGPTTTGTVHSGAENYGLNLVYPGGGALASDYRRDDGVVTLYGPSSWLNSDGEGSALTYEAGGATLSVMYVNAIQ